MSEPLRFVPCGDRALLVYLGETIDPAVNDRVHALAAALRQKRHPALVEVTPSYHCLLVEYDPVRIRLEQVADWVRTLAADPAMTTPETRTVVIPVRYGGDEGPDLEAVATHTGLSPEEVVRLHAAGSYRVYCLGFSPGFPYLGGLEEALHTPRLAEPRTRVPGGSVGIGGSQTGIYPAPSPGGWRLIGQTPLRLFDPWRNPPALLQPGDTVRFVPIGPEEFAAQQAAQQPAPAPNLPQPTDGRTGLRILQPGLATTIQDLGRRGYMGIGVPVAGAADFWSLMVGNWLLGNRARTAALEITLSGPEVEFTGPVAFCLTGGPVAATLTPAGGGSPRPVAGWTTVLAGPGDRLRIGTTLSGCRAYLCVAGGIDLPPVLGSLSEDLFGKIGPLGRPLQAGDWLPVGLPLQPPADLAGRALPADAVPRYTGQAVIRAVRGPQDQAFTRESLAAFFQGEYRVGAQSDRQGLRLEGPRLTHAGRPDILSEPIPAGSVQVPAGGQPILLLGNRQTVGGYTKIAVAVYPDLAQAAQLRPGDRLRFQEVDVAEAHAIAWAERRRLAQIRRYLERGGSHLAAPTVPPPALLTSDAAAPPSPSTGLRRSYRIRIGGIEFEALVEEVADQDE
jgi:KipI family sensor histidine kinase inhibitor